VRVFWYWLLGISLGFVLIIVIFVRLSVQFVKFGLELKGYKDFGEGRILDTRVIRQNGNLGVVGSVNLQVNCVYIVLVSGH